MKAIKGINYNMFIHMTREPTRLYATFANVPICVPSNNRLVKSRANLITATLIAIGRRFSRCIRTHRDPGLFDAVESFEQIGRQEIVRKRRQGNDFDTMVYETILIRSFP